MQLGLALPRGSLDGAAQRGFHPDALEPLPLARRHGSAAAGGASLGRCHSDCCRTRGVRGSRGCGVPRACRLSGWAAGRKLGRPGAGRTQGDGGRQEPAKAAQARRRDLDTASPLPRQQCTPKGGLQTRSRERRAGKPTTTGSALYDPLEDVVFHTRVTGQLRRTAGPCSLKAPPGSLWSPPAGLTRHTRARMGCSSQHACR